MFITPRLALIGTGTFGISDADGKFSFEVNRAGTYSLEFSYVGYKTLHREVEILPFEPKLGKFKMKEDPKMLAEVETIGHSERIKQKGDTLSYNASAYEVIEGEERLGGAIVAFSNDGEHGDLHFLYTRVGKQNRGVASFAWRTIEGLHPDPNDFNQREVNPMGSDGFFRFEKTLK